MPRNDAATPCHVCPHIGIHAIDIVQPPGIGIAPIVDMEADQMIVTAALAAKSNAETPRKARSEAVRASAKNVTSVMMRCLVVSVLIVPADPLHREIEAVLVAALGHEVEVLVGAVHHVDAARVAGIGVEHLAVLILGEDADSDLV